MKRAFWALFLVPVLVYSSCNCGNPGGNNTDGGNGSGLPCQNASECQTGESCYASVCAINNPDGGPNEDVNGNPVWTYPPQEACLGLACNQVTNCPAAEKTTVTGKVYTPAGDLPLYNAIVYVPNGTVQPFDAGVSCDRCAAATGNPIAETTTGPDGTFRLENVPANVDIPLVIQLGRWRRQVTLSQVGPCQQREETNVDLLRLPKNKAEGDIPLMAIASGNADPFECLLRKIGIDDAEVTVPTGTGRIHFYRENGVDMSPAAPAASTLWGDLNTLKQYDVVMLPCEGSENPSSAKTAAKQRIVDYTSAGGRIFTTHYSYTWIRDSMTPFPPVANWQTRVSQTDNCGTNPPGNPLYCLPFGVTVDQSFAKGQAFSNWLNFNQAWGTDAGTATPGTLFLRETRHNVDSVLPQYATRWLYADNHHVTPMSQPIVTHFTFNTPVSGLLPDGGAPDQCGRVVFSSFHVSANAKTPGSNPYPASCKNEPPTAQEKALIFMLFDLSACVQRDDLPIIN
jgi:hypothetical protein